MTTLQSSNYKNPQFRDQQKNNFRYNKNQFIRATEVRLINENSEQIGIVPLEEALKLAREAELDLIEVSPNAKPPVCKIMSWSKFQYDISKKDNKAKKTKLKEMRFKPLIGTKDLEHKLKRVKEFIEDKNIVKLTVQGVGRIRQEQQREVMKKILDIVNDYAEIDQMPKNEGRHLSVTIRPGKQKVKTAETPKEVSN